MSSRQSGSKKTVGVRLDRELYAILEQEAAKASVSPTTLAASLLAEALARGGPTPSADPRVDAILDTLERIERELPGRIASIFRPAAPKPERPTSRPRTATLDEYLQVRLKADAGDPPDEEEDP